tara:strand:+ start:1483 stop:1956 length:474 start_codon:yes stop_codon:yes gene_type:complete
MTNYVLNESKMFADITDGMAIVINGETGVYYGMNTLGTSVFENIIAGATIEDVLLSLKGLDGATDTVEANLNSFVESLVEKEILLSGEELTKEVSIAEDAAKLDNFVMTVDEYSDAQELLLADPIHEVKEDSGWTPEKDSIGYSKEETLEREKKMEK